MGSVLHEAKQLLEDEKYQEIKIPMPWGFIAGKWYGATEVRPIVCVHGWQDNAGAYDNLIPLLPKHLSYLAIDLPGHGLSSWLPDGAPYNFYDLIVLFKIIKETYKWEKISIMGHSLSAAMSFLYTGIFPEDVDVLIALDTLKLNYYEPARCPDFYKYNLYTYLHFENQNKKKIEPPSATFEEHVLRFHKKSRGSVTKEAARCILRRGLVKSKINPNLYCTTHDNRIKSGIARSSAQEFNVELGQRILIPHLYIKAKESKYYEAEHRRQEIVDVCLKTNPKFEYHRITGQHHFHLTDPHNCCEIISKFLNTYRPKSCDIENVKKNEKSKL